MLKKSASIVLASFRGSEELEGIFRSPRVIIWANGYTQCGWYLLASSLAAALLVDLFEYPARLWSQRYSVTFHRHFGTTRVFPQPVNPDHRLLASFVIRTS